MNNLFIRRNINTIIKTITPEINNFTLYNSQYIDRIDITVYNPKPVSKDSLFPPVIVCAKGDRDLEIIVMLKYAVLYSK